MRPRAFARPTVLRVLLTLLCCLVLGLGNARAQSSVPVVIERPQWAIGDWWEFKDRSSEYRETVIVVSADHYLLARSKRGEAIQGAEGRVTVHADLDGWITKMVDQTGKTKPTSEKRRWVRFPLHLGDRWFFNTAGWDFDLQVERWEPIEIDGRRIQALRIAGAERQRGGIYTQMSGFNVWYAPEAKRVIRLGRTSYPPLIDLVAFGGTPRIPTSPPVIAAPFSPSVPASIAATPPPPPLSVTSRPPAAPSPRAVDAGKRFAVIIGVGAYEHAAIPKLRYAARDAEAMQHVLIERAGFKKEHVLLLTDHTSTKPTLRNIKSALGTFLARSAAKGDTVLVFFAGHGAPEVDPRGVERDGLAKYLIPSDADPEDLYATALSMDEIQTIFSRIEADLIVVFVDACYSGAAGGRTFASRRMQTRTLAVDERFLERLTGGKGRAIITASRPSEVSIELNDLQHGLFTYYVVEGLKGAGDLDRDGIVTLQELYTYVEREVSRKSRAVGGNQHPVLKGELEGPFPLVSVKPR